MHYFLILLLTFQSTLGNCSDPHFDREGGTIYPTGFFVQTILADRYIHCREIWVVSFKSMYILEYGIKKIFSISVFTGVMEV